MYNEEKNEMNDKILMMKEYENKISYLEKTFETLVKLNEKKNLEREKNNLKIKKEINNSLKEIKLYIENHKNNMIYKIDNYFSQIQNSVLYMIQNKDVINNNNYIQLDKLNDIIKNEIPKIYQISNNLSVKNKENVEKIKNIFYKEIKDIKNNLIQNENIRKENEVLMNDKIGQEIENMIQIFSQIKSKREEYEQNMFSQINDIVVKMKNALG